MSTTYYKQGVYPIKNPQKYKGILPAIYRSQPELSIMIWMDKNDRIVEWTSESVIIPYIKPTDGKIHRYFIDFSCKFRENNGSITKYIIEYKPLKQTQLPIPSNRKKERTFLMEQMNYAINMAKWKAAREYARSEGLKFLIITEKDLGN